MDGRAVKESQTKGDRRGLLAACRRGLACAAVALACAPGVAGAQAMGKIVVDGPSPLPMVSTRPAEPAKSPLSAAVSPEVPGRGAELAANMGSTPAAPVAVTPAAPATPGRPVTMVDPVGRTAAPLPTVEPSVPKPETPATGGPPAGSGAAAAAAAPVAAVKPSIEQKPIRVAGDTAPAGGATDTAKTSGLPSLGFGQVIAALAIVIGLIFVGRALVRKFVPGARATSGKGVIEILARHPLAKNQAIVLVRIGSQIVALNQGRESSQSVLVINDAMEVAKIIGQLEGKNPASAQAGFNKLLANARMDLEETGEEDTDLKTMSGENLDEQLEEMAAAKRQLMELRQHVRTVRDSLPRE